MCRVCTHQMLLVTETCVEIVCLQGEATKKKVIKGGGSEAGL